MNNNSVIIELKPKTFKQKAKQTFWEAKRFVYNNWESIAAGAATGAALTKGVSSIVNRIASTSRAKSELKFKETHIYDRSIGAYIPIKHKLSEKEISAINEAKSKGLRIGEILQNMDLVKK